MRKILSLLAFLALFMPLPAYAGLKAVSTPNTGGAIPSFSFGTTGLTPNTPSTGAIVAGGTLTCGNGGTGITSYTSGGLVYASSTTSLATSNTITANDIIVGQGAGAAPFDSGLYAFLPTDTTVGGSIAIGSSALSGQTSSAGYGNTAIGYQAAGNGVITTAAVSDTFIGNLAGRNLTSGNQDTFVGNGAGAQLTSGQFETAVGFQALDGSGTTAVTGNDNTAVGREALFANTSGADNTALGFKAGAAMVSNADGTFVGSSAGLLVTGASNTIIGFSVGSTTLTTGSNNILIGTSATTTTNGAADTHEIAIGGVGLGSNTTEIGLSGTTTGTTIYGAITLPAVTTGTNADFACFASGNVMTLQSSACTISQRKLKENFLDVTATDAVNDVMALKPTQFNFKPGDTPNADPNYGHTQLGFIAEDVAAVDPRLSVFENDMVTPKSYRETAMLAILVKTAQVQETQIKALNDQIAAMGGRSVMKPVNDNWLQHEVKKLLNL